MIDQQIAKSLFGLGCVVLALAAFDVETPLRPVATLVFFGAGPGAAIVPRLHVPDPLLRASLAIGVSVVIAMAVAMAMLWAGVSSPVLATLAVLAVMAAALYAPAAAIHEEVEA